MDRSAIDNPLEFEAQVIACVWQTSLSHLGPETPVMSVSLSGTHPDTSITVEWQDLRFRNPSEGHSTRSFRIWTHPDLPLVDPDGMADDILQSIWMQAHGD